MTDSLRQITERMANALEFYAANGNDADTALNLYAEYCKNEQLTKSPETVSKDAVSNADDNYQGAMADLEDLLRVCIENRAGLDGYLKDNYPNHFREVTKKVPSEIPLVSILALEIAIAKALNMYIELNGDLRDATSKVFEAVSPYLRSNVREQGEIPVLTPQMKFDIANKIRSENRSSTDIVQDVYDEIMSYFPKREAVDVSVIEAAINEALEARQNSANGPDPDYYEIVKKYSSLNRELVTLDKPSVVDQLEKALGCFDAAVAEGLYDRLVEIEPELGNIRDLIERRVLHAQSHIMAAMESVQGKISEIEVQAGSNE